MKRIIGWWNHTRTDWYYEKWSNGANGPRESIVKLWLLFVWWTAYSPVRYGIGGILCHFLGHGRHFHCEDWGNPNSGGMAGYCDRCGWSYHQILY